LGSAFGSAAFGAVLGSAFGSAALGGALGSAFGSTALGGPPLSIGADGRASGPPVCGCGWALTQSVPANNAAVVDAIAILHFIEALRNVPAPTENYKARMRDSFLAGSHVSDRPIVAVYSSVVHADGRPRIAT
jgi:hypothetical protein